MNILKQFSKVNAGNEITKQEGNLSLLILGSVIPGLFYLKKYNKVDFGALIFTQQESHGRVFFDLQKYRDVTESAFKSALMLGNVNDIPEIKDFRRLEKEINDLYNQFSPHRLKELSMAELIERINHFYSTFHQLIACTVFSEAVDETLTKKLYDSVGGEPDIFKAFYENSGLVDFQSFVTRLDGELLKYDQKNPYTLQWLFSEYYMAPKLDGIEILISDKVRELGGNEAIRREKDLVSIQAANNALVIQKFTASLSPKLLTLFSFIHLCSYLRDIRKEAIHKTASLISNGVREIYNRLDIDEDYVPYAYCWDFIKDAYKSGNYKETLVKRRKSVALYVDKNNSFFDCENVDQITQNLFALIDGSDNTVAVRGQVACTGLASGIARIIMSALDFSQFQQGDVLVTSMTRPEFVPLMRKAVAIVTDEGGITSHAAIISRELNKPCVIGTKNATRKLKTGQLIEVDATNGIVKIISQE